MAAIKFGFVIICALFVSKVASTPIENDLQQSPAANQTEQLIKFVTKYLGILIDDADKITTNLTHGGMDQFQKSTMNITYVVLGDVKKFVDKELDRIYPDLNKNAQKVSTCIKAHSNDLIQVIVSFYDATTRCFNPAFIPLLASVKPLLTESRAIDSTVAALAPSLETCENDFCIFGVLAKVLQQIKNLVDVLEKDLPPVVALLKPFLHTVVECAKSDAEPWRKDFIRMFNEAATCYRS